MKWKNSERSGFSIKRAGIGTFISVVMFFIIMMIASALVEKGSVQEERIGVVVAATVFVGAFIGSFVSTINCRDAVLLQIGAVFLAIVLGMIIANIAFLDGQFVGLGRNALSALSGSVVSLLLRSTRSKGVKITKMRVL